MRILENIGVGMALTYFVLILAIGVGWIGNLFHAFNTTSTTGLILTLAGVLVAPLGALKFFFF